MTATDIHVRWAIRRDLAAMERADDADDGQGWGTDRFLCWLRQRPCVAMVAEVGEEVGGFLCYTLHDGYLSLDRLQVAPQWRGQGLGSAMLAKMAAKVVGHRRHCQVATPVGHWPAILRREWQTTAVCDLLSAEAPTWVLADALEEAGCTAEWPLSVLRQGGRFADALLRLWAMEERGCSRSTH